MTHALFSQETEEPIEWFDKFDRKGIKQAITKHLSQNPTDTIEHCKDYSKSDVKKYYGMEIINFYQCNSKGQPCLVVTKGDKEYLRKLK